jgi:DNA-binding beta-propeller fold protein YncE
MKTLTLCLALGATSTAAAAPLELVATIEMPGVKGRIDHLAADVKGGRLFVAALGNDTVEVVDMAANRHRRSLTGFGEPQGVAYVPEANRVYVANGSANRVDVLDGTSLATLHRVERLDDADNVRYDSAARTIVVGYGKGSLRFVKADSAEPIRDIRLAGHPESFQLDAAAKRIYVNVPTAQHVAVVDAAKGAVVATWPVRGARSNFPMALDVAQKRLFVGARSPALLLTYDTDTGNLVTKVSIGGDTDDLFYDAQRKRLYVICGEGRIDVLRQDTPDRYSLEASINTAPRARTGLFVATDARLYVAAPAEGRSTARVLVYQAK